MSPPDETGYTRRPPGAFFATGGLMRETREAIIVLTLETFIAIALVREVAYALAMARNRNRFGLGEKSWKLGKC